MPKSAQFMQKTFLLSKLLKFGHFAIEQESLYKIYLPTGRLLAQVSNLIVILVDVFVPINFKRIQFKLTERSWQINDWIFRN